MSLYVVDIHGELEGDYEIIKKYEEPTTKNDTEMTIDAHIEVLKSYNNGFTGYAGNLQNSINVAIDTMRKYQKIVGIVSLNDEEFKQCGLKELKEILEVIWE